MTSLRSCLLFFTISLLLTLNPKAQPETLTPPSIPYPTKHILLDNGLNVYLVQSNNKGLINYTMLLRVGARNEVDEGRTGFAHFFEHLMFRGTPRYPREKAVQTIKKTGANDNAYTWHDRTVYYETFAKEELETILDYEADRFQNLAFSEAEFATESLAVLGEYNKNASDPETLAYERIVDLAFDHHTYEHTTMGFLKDIKNFPNLYNYAWTFYQQYYRPEYANLFLVGDLDIEQAESLVRRYFSSWKQGDYTPTIQVEPEQEEPREEVVTVENRQDTQLIVGYKVPGTQRSLKEMTQLQLIADLGFSETSPLFQELKIKNNLVQNYHPYFWNKNDPFLVMVHVSIPDSSNVELVKSKIISAFENFPQEPITNERLHKTLRKKRYESLDLLYGTDEEIADQLVETYYLLNRNDAYNHYWATMFQATPEEILHTAQRYFKPSNRNIVITKSSTADNQ